MPQLFPAIPSPLAPGASLAPGLTLAPDPGGFLTPLLPGVFVPPVLPRVGLHPAVGLYPVGKTVTPLTPIVASSGTLSPV